MQPSLGFSKAIALLPSRNSDITDDPENPFTTSLFPGSGFALASSHQLVSSEPSIKQDHESWPNPVGFQTATLVPASTSSSGFVSLRSKTALAPSVAALAQAQARLKEIWDDESENVNPLAGTKDQAQTNVEPVSHRPALQALDNRPQTPSTPTPTGFPRPSVPGKQLQAIDQLRVKQKPFRSPLLKNTPKSRFTSSPVSFSTNFAPAASMSSHDPTIPSTPLRPNLKLSSFQTPTRAPTSTQRTTPAPFVTPFKPGMRPGEPGWAKIQASIPKGSIRFATHASAASFYDPSRRPEAKSFFNLRRSSIMPSSR